jgi:hypothetical protein
VEQNITMQGGTINWGGSIEDRIRQIVREEIAAHEERRVEYIALSEEQKAVIAEGFHFVRKGGAGYAEKQTAILA